MKPHCLFENSRVQDCTQQETADILGWSVTKVKNYSALSKVTELAWSAIVTEINSVTEEVTNVTFTEGILRPIIPLSESQQLDLVEGLISQKYSKQAFKKRAEVYQQNTFIQSFARLQNTVPTKLAMHTRASPKPPAHRQGQRQRCWRNAESY